MTTYNTSIRTPITHNNLYFIAQLTELTELYDITH